MEISGSSINQPVSFYQKNMGNTINTAIDGENHLYSGNVFASGLSFKESQKTITQPSRKKRKSKRLNTIDTDYLPDETESADIKNTGGNFFMEEERKKPSKNIKKAFEHFITTTPLVNYFFLKQKQEKIQETVKTLSDINRNVDELLNTAVPFGEEMDLYQDIAKNLTDAATVIGRANKEL